MDILTGENMWSNQVANMDPYYWSIRLSSKRGDDWVMGVKWRNRYFSPLRVSLYLRFFKSGVKKIGINKDNGL